MKCLVVVLTTVACVGLASSSGVAADPFRDRHFVHFQLQQYYNLQDYNRYTWGSSYTTGQWSGNYPRQSPYRDVIAPAGELPRVLPTPDYTYHRTDLEYYRSLIPGSPAAYLPPPPVKFPWWVEPQR
jgi:hypothetical protein